MLSHFYEYPCILFCPSLLPSLCAHQHFVSCSLPLTETVLPCCLLDLTIDSKAIPSLSKGENKKQNADGRREKEANWGRKEYRGTHKNGTAWEKIVKWFGYKVHL